MSFGDLMSSGRGPGVVGLLVALIVVGGFGAIFVFVFDKEMQGGGKTIEYTLQEQEDEIDTLKVQIAHGEEKIRNSEIADANEIEAVALKKKIADASAKADGLGERMTKAVSETVEIEKGFDEYRDSYRHQAREDAVGEEFDELTTVSGDKYTKVQIREVTEVGISVRHEFGSKRITFEELTPEWQERFQFDPVEKAKALAREAEKRRLYEEAIAAHTEVAEGPQAEVAPAPAEQFVNPSTPDELRRAITAKEIQLAKLKTQWGQLQGAAVKVQHQDGVERAQGRHAMPKIKEMRQRIQLKEREIAKVTRELATLRSKAR